MKFITSTILTALLSFATCLFLPWWVIAIVGFVVAFAIPQKAGVAFLAGFVALFLLWAGLSFYISNNNGHLLAHKISLLFIKVDNTTLLFLFTGLIGGLVAGFGSLSGRLFRKLFLAK
ncbi:MAG: hypothetical protein ABL929_02425 [Ferruginibacter sp.]|nr:hypothetical protein [Ferruginibacter sp.]